MKELRFGTENQRKNSVPSKAIDNWTCDKFSWIFDRKTVSNSTFYYVLEYIVLILFLHCLTVYFFLYQYEIVYN